MSVCRQCSLRIQDGDNFSIVCKGSCKSSFHGSCIGMRTFQLNVLVTLSNNVLWMCDGCMSDFQQASYNRTSDVLNKPKLCEKTMKNDIDELKKNVANIMSVISSTNCCLNDTRTSAVPTSPDNCLIFKSPVSLPLTGSNVCEAISTDDAEQQRQQCTMDGEFALLLTNIDVSATESDIHRMASQAIGIRYPERIVVTKLVSKWKCHNYDFVSFKIVFDLKFKSRAMDARSWPRNIKFREFVYRSNNAWKPNSLK